MEAERCCVCGEKFGWVDFLTWEIRQTLSRNGKHICTVCYRRYLAELAMKGDEEKK